MWTHGMWTEGQRWPERRADALAWLKQRGYAQFTQAAESKDGITFSARPAITRQSYLRVFRHQGQFYGMARLGLLLRAKDALDAFELGESPFRATPYEGRVRHVALLPQGNRLDIFFSAIGDAPESIYHTTVDIGGDWREWRVGLITEVLTPQAPYECTTFRMRNQRSARLITPRGSCATRPSSARTARRISSTRFVASKASRVRR